MKQTELSIKNRIAKLRSRRKDNGRIIAKQERKLAKLTNGR